MAENKEIIVDLKINVGDVTQRISQATDALTKQKLRLAELKDETENFTKVSANQAAEIAAVKKSIEEQTRTIKSNTAVLQASNTTFDTANMTLEQQRQAVNTLQKAYAALTPDQIKAAGGAEVLQGKIKAATDALREQEHAIGDDRRNVGNYAESIQKATHFTKDLADGLKQSGAVSGEMAQGIDAVSKVADAFTKNPILGILQILWQVISGNKEAMDALKKGLQYLANAFKQIEPYITAFGNIMGKVVMGAIKGVVEGIGWLMKQLDKIGKAFGKDWDLSGSFNNLTTAITNTTTETGNLADELEKAKQKAKELHDAAVEAFVEQMELNQVLQHLFGSTENSAAQAFDSMIKNHQKYTDAIIHDSEMWSEEEEAENEKDLQRTMELMQRKKDIQAQYQKVTLDDMKAAELAAIDELREAHIISAEEEGAMKAEIMDKYRQMEMENAANEIDGWANQIMGAFSAISDAMGARDNAELAKYEKDNNKKKKVLDDRLKAGLMSQEQYDAQVEKMDADLDKKKMEIEDRAAKREKAMGIMSAVVNTATAIMRIWADVPKADFGVTTAIMTALAAATGAAQIATIAAEPLPSQSFAEGGIVEGTSYSGDKVRVNANSGEMYINRQDQQTLFNSIKSGQLGSGIDYELLGGTMAAAVAAQPAPIVDYTEMQKFGQKVTTYKQIAKI